MNWLEWEILYWKWIPASSWIYIGSLLSVVALFAFWGIIERRQGRERYLVTQSAAMTWTVVWSILGVTGLVLKSVSGGMSPSMFRAGMMMLLAPILPVAVWLQWQWNVTRVLVLSNPDRGQPAREWSPAYRYVLEPIGFGKVQLHVVKRSKSRFMRLIRIQKWKPEQTSNIGVLGGRAALVGLLNGLLPGEQIELITPNAGLTKALDKAVKKGLPAEFAVSPAARRLGHVALLGGRLLGGGWSWAFAMRNQVISGYRIRRM